MIKKTYKGIEYTLFFVLKGLVDGEEGMLAQRSGTGEELKDGWYFLTDDNPDGDGPYDFKEEADQYAQMGLDGEEEARAVDAFTTLIQRFRNYGFDDNTIKTCFEEGLNG